MDGFSHDGGREVVLGGFFGRGNCGDEAMLQCLYEAFAPGLRVAIALDRFGAHPEHDGWYPYADAYCFHQAQTSHISDCATPAGLIIGGGDLPIGFCANLVAVGRAFGVPAILAGVDLAENWLVAHERDPAFVRDYLGQFRLVMVRSEESVRIAARLGVPVMLGADLAFRLPSDAAPDRFPMPGRALVVVREFPPELTPANYLGVVRELLAALAAAGMVPVLLPFAPEDERFLAETGIDTLAPVERCWWNARRVKQVIANSGLLVSLGRLHPLIFAASSGTPAVAIDPPVLNDAGRIWKIEALCAEFRIPHFRAPDAFMGWLARRSFPAPDPARVAAAEARLETGLAAIRAALGL